MNKNKYSSDMNTKQKIEEILLNDFGCFDEYTVDKLLNLFSVSVPLPSDKLIEERGEEFESKTYYNLEEGEKIGDFEVGAKWVVDYLQGNER